ncbi:ABC transporter ATP-binding protein [Staphylococcus aureus]|uniref:ABC transporter ATP-binding protein n=13 Tax=Staphylococcus TaxID=1279 RepID=UPI0004539AA8|nr:ABC transporter ATP-binding protein [Staphylococcus aureus]EWJ01889.1 oligopeptide ABC transporter, ATP-binding protein [Staphylococcus aureus M91160]EWK88656.1 oligopeptide ABC transporter, ATP-binding protein [Staphylococcus aureus M62699]
MNNVLLEVKDLETSLKINNEWLATVENISFELSKGEVLGIVGESGCGKSILSKSIIKLLPEKISKLSSGEVIFDGKRIDTLNEKQLLDIRGNDIAMIFQEPMTALNPVFTIKNQLVESIKSHKKISKKEEIKKEVLYLLKCVGLSEDAYYKYAHEFSGGQRQRVGIARALALRPSLIVADEPVSALDVSVQSQVLNLLKDLQEQFKLSYLFIAHDLSVVKHISDVIGVMYLGHIVEIASDKEIYENPKHPYTKALISSIPQIDKHNNNRIILKGELPSPSNPPQGCPFHTRCPIAKDKCKENIPQLKDIGNEHQVACFYVDKVGDLNA